MKNWIDRLSPTILIVYCLIQAPAIASPAEDLFKQGQMAYETGQAEQALDYFQQAVQADETLLDAYFNMGAIYYNQKRYNEALEAFNNFLRKNPDDQKVRYETGRIFEKLGRIDEAIAAFEMVSSSSSRHHAAQQNIQRLEQQKVAAAEARRQQEQQQKEQALKEAAASQPTQTQPVASFVEPEKPKPLELSQPAAINLPKETTASVQTTQPQSTASLIESEKQEPFAKPQTESISSSAIFASTDLPSKGQAIVQEFVDGFSGPTGVAVDTQGNLYVANFSKNTIYKVLPNGDKKLMAEGLGINGPVGLTIDDKTGNLYIANHLDNTISKITQDGIVSVIATGLKRPYNIIFDQAHQTLFVSQQDSNSIAKIKLN